MEQLKPLSPNVDNMKALVYEINRSNNALVQAINRLETTDTGRKIEYKKKESLFHAFGGSRKDSIAAKYYALGEVTSHEAVPNNTIYTTGNNAYWIKDDTGVPREIGASGEGGVYLPIDGKAADSELLDGYHVEELTFLSDFLSHTVDSSIHFTGNEIDHTAIQNIGTNTHVQIDSHIVDTSIHYPQTSINHGVLQGLADDDHLQYHNDTRGDLRYYPRTEADITFLGIAAKAADSDLLDGNDSTYFAVATDLSTHIGDSSIHFTQASIDHGSILGLLDDDHTQYHNNTRGDIRYYTRTLADATFEPIFAKNTAFNKNFGTIAGTVAEGNHLHTGVYEPANANIQSHIASTSNPHSVTPSQIGNDTAQWNAYKLYNTPIDATVGTPTDGDVLVYRAAGGDFVLETKPTPGVNDHGGLLGLGDDDHTQYYNQSRGDARYGQLSATNYWTARQDVDSFYWKEGVNYINSDPRWIGTNGRIYWWATNGSGTPYGQFGHALYNGSSYTLIDTVSGADGIRVTDKVEAYNPVSEGSYLGLFKGLGSRPGSATFRYPTIKTDYSAIYFAPSESFVGGIISNSATDRYFFVRGESGEEIRIKGPRDSYTGISCKYTSIGESELSQNSSGGVLNLENNAGTTNCLISSYGGSYFVGGSVSIGTSVISDKFVVEENAATVVAAYLRNINSGGQGVIIRGGSSDSLVTASFRDYNNNVIAKIGGSGNLTLSGTIQQDSWTGLTLATGWTALSTSTLGTIAYYVDKQGVTHLRGQAISDATATSALLTLPVDARPANDVYVPTTGTVTKYIYVTASTGVVTVSPNPSNGEVTTLTSLSFTTL